MSRKAQAALNKRRPQTRRHDAAPMPAPYTGKRTLSGFVRNVSTSHSEVYMGMAKPRRGACTRYAGYKRVSCETSTQYGVASYIERHK